MGVAGSQKNAGVKRPGGIHTLRNCYATHHLEGGTDLVFLQEQMGHKQLKTTIRYIGLCRKTPLRSASDQWDGYPVSDTNSIGALFRAHGERYIQAYKPHQRAIAFIRSVRLCRTPGLGRIVYTCKGCGSR